VNMSKPYLLGISGSIRRQSYNTTILTSLAEAVGDWATLEIFPLNDVPLYNQDTDGENRPETVLALDAAIARADGIVISSPEYNYGMSGVLKKRPRLGVQTVRQIKTDRQTGADDDDVSGVHRRRAGSGPVERDSRLNRRARGLAPADRDPVGA